MQTLLLLSVGFWAGLSIGVILVIRSKQGKDESIRDLCRNNEDLQDKLNRESGELNIVKQKLLKFQEQLSIIEQLGAQTHCIKCGIFVKQDKLSEGKIRKICDKCGSK